MTATAAYRVEVLHLSMDQDLPPVSRVYEFGSRHVAVPCRCLDCSAPWTTIPPDHGCQAALLIVHEAQCWSMRRLVTEGGAP